MDNNNQLKIIKAVDYRLRGNDGRGFYFLYAPTLSPLGCFAWQNDCPVIWFRLCCNNDGGVGFGNAIEVWL